MGHQASSETPLCLGVCMAAQLAALASDHGSAAHPPDVDQIWHLSIFPAVPPPSLLPITAKHPPIIQSRVKKKEKSNHFWMSAKNFNLHNQSDFWEIAQLTTCLTTSEKMNVRFPSPRRWRRRSAEERGGEIKICRNALNLYVIKLEVEALWKAATRHEWETAAAHPNRIFRGNYTHFCLQHNSNSAYRSDTAFKKSACRINKVSKMTFSGWILLGWNLFCSTSRSKCFRLIFLGALGVPGWLLFVFPPHPPSPFSLLWHKSNLIKPLSRHLSWLGSAISGDEAC